MITVGEPVMTYNRNVEETTALTSNELLFLANAAPGNAITFSQGEMAILNKLDTIMPMAAGLHKRLPQPKTGPYADNTLPSTNDSDSINILENVIDGEEMVKRLVAQARIAQEVKKTYLEIAQKHNITINERNGDLANIMMNTVFEEYERKAGTERRDLATTTSYADIAEDMFNSLLIIKDKQADKNEKLTRMTSLKEQLVRCAMDKELRDLTQIYRDKQQSNPIGYDPIMVSRFISNMRKAYPKDAKLEVETRGLTPEEFTKNITKEAIMKNSDYHGYDSGDLLFDIQNTYHRDALEQVIQGIIFDGIPVDGVQCIEKSEGIYNILISGVRVGFYEDLGGSYNTEFDVKPAKLSELVSKNAMLNMRINEIFNEG